MLLSRRQREILELALEDRSTFASRTRSRLAIGGLDHTHLLTALSGEEDDGPGMLLTATFAARLPDSIEGQRVELDLLIDHPDRPERVPFPAFRGEATDPEQKGYHTELLCATIGYYHGQTDLGGLLVNGEIAFPGYYPSTVLYEALSVVEAAIPEIPTVREPLFSRGDEGSEDFRWTDTVADLVEAVEEESGLVLWDGPDGVERGFLEDSLAMPGDPVLDVEVGRDTVERPELTPKFAERVHSVVVYIEEEGKHRELAKARVQHRHYSPPKWRRKLIATTDPDPEKAQATANKEANVIVENESEFSVELLYVPPHVHRGVAITLRDYEYATEERGVESVRGRYKREYICRVYGKTPDYYKKRCGLKGDAKLLSEVFEVLESRGVVEDDGGVAGPLWGERAGNPYIDDSLAWVRDDGNELVLDTVIAAASGVSVYVDPEDWGVVVITHASTPFVWWGRDDGRLWISTEVHYVGVDSGGFWIDEELAAGRAGTDETGVWLDG